MRTVPSLLTVASVILFGTAMPLGAQAAIRDANIVGRISQQGTNTTLGRLRAPGSISGGGSSLDMEISPAPYISFTGRDGVNVTSQMTFYFGVQTTNTGPIPIVIHYALRSDRSDTATNAYASASIAIYSGPGASVDTEATCNQCANSGTLTFTVFANDLTNSVTLSAGGYGGSASGFADPRFEIDPAYAAIDPDYMNDTQILLSDGVANAMVADAGPIAVPEPGSLALLMGTIGMGAAVRRRRAA